MFIMDSRNIKTRIKEKWNYLPFVILGIVLLYFHFHIETNYGDDVVFRETALTSGFKLFSWLHERYQTWTSRTFIEMFLMIMVSLPQIIWKVLDALMMTIISVFMAKNFCKEEYEIQKNWITAGLCCTVDIGILKEAGWIATTVNYIWPLAFGLVSVYSIKKICLNKNIRFFEYLIYSVCLLAAVSSEQICVVLLIAFGAGNLIWYQSNKKINKYLALQFAMCIVGLANILLCPGNARRTASEIENWFPAYAGFGVLKKAELGISCTLKTIFLQDNIWILIFLVILCAAIWMKYDNWIYKITAVIPAVSVVFLCHAHEGRGDGRLPFNILGDVGVFRPDTLGSLKIFVIYAGLLFLCCIILIDIYIVFGNTSETLLTGGTFLLGLMTRAMMGFSPTIWKSGGRPGICLIYALLCCSVLVINTLDFCEKKTIDMIYLFVLLVGIGGIVDNYNFIFLY